MGGNILVDMENINDKFHLSVEKLRSNKENVKNIPSTICGNSGNPASECISSSVKSKYFQNTKPVAKDSQEKSKISSVLDPYCKTNILDESDDFIFSEPVTKVKNSKNEYTGEICKREIISCEICKEDITHLDVYNRGVHVNNCIDKQTAIPPALEVKTSVSENIFILECPLCFKHFSSPELRSNHIKKCGKSKGLSLQSIIKALELQERHAQERISLGLPAKPLKPVKSHRSTASKKVIVEPKNKTESDIQLARALSLSLTKTSEQSEEENIENIKYVTLKPPDSHQHPGRKAKRFVTPVLVLRTEEERKKLLLDKVATIVAPQSLVEEETPVSAECSSYQKKGDHVCVIPLLWQLSGKALGKHEYYVESLLDWIQPSDVEAGTKLHHLSQIAGHEIVTQLPCDYTFSSEETKQENCVNFTGDDCPPPSDLIGSLRSLVASSWMSDVDIYTTCGSIIPAHRLLLAVRCPPLKQDSDFCSKPGRASLKWENTSFSAALQFLNFIYTGTIEIEENMKSDILYLANKYEVSELQALLHSNASIGMWSDVRPNEKISEELSSKDLTLPYLSPSRNQVSDDECPAFETQDDNNMDLEIVYNCINSSLKPSQISVEEPLNLSPTASSQPEYNINSKIFSDSCHSESVPISHSPEECSSPKGALSARISSTSPVIFDVTDDESEVEMEVDSDGESVELPVNCSQKSVLQECDLDDVELDMCSTKSFSSQDSVKFLESSFPGLSKTPMEEKTGLVSSSPQFQTSFCSRESPSAIIDNVSKDSPNSYCESNTQKLNTSEFQGFVSGKDANVESPSTKHFKRSLAQYEDKIHNDDEIIVKEISAMDSTVKNTIIHPIVESEVAENVRDSYNTILSDQISVVSSKDYETDLIHPKEFSAIESNLFKSIEKTPSPSMSEALTFDYERDLKSHLNNSYKKCTSLKKRGDIFCSEIKSNFNDELDEEHQNNSLNSQEIRNFSKKDSQNDDTSVFLASSTSNTMSNCINNVSVDRKTVMSPEIPHTTSVRKDSLNSPFLGKEKYELYENISFTLLPHEDIESYKLENVFGSAPKPYKPLDDPHECNENFEQYISKESKEAKQQTPKNIKFITNNPIIESATPSTNSHPKFQLTDSPITPFPDYKNMVTPDIKQALQKIGVKPLPRKKAIAVLSHVYNETHPLINGEANTESGSPVKPYKTEKSKKRKKRDDNTASRAKRQQVTVNCTQNTNGTQDSDDSSSENPEWQGCVPEISFSQFTQDSPTKTSKDDIDLIKQYIQSNEELYNNVLTYSPLNLVSFHQELKNTGIKMSIQKLMDFLDDQCITFTCPRKEEYRKKQTARTQRFRKNMIAKLSQQTT